jgi:hypothetical protein
VAYPMPQGFYKHLVNRISFGRAGHVRRHNLDPPGPRVASCPLLSQRLSSMVVRPKPLRRGIGRLDSQVQVDGIFPLTLRERAFDLTDIDARINAPPDIHVNVATDNHVVSCEYIHLDL